ncbi:hypothetical protein AVEN_50016-1 [Araneus ventricosus]|uniref:Uncharacterized protein n=1 Tax=Araneus ventricosus TaxID=182803 RepID=A0A4Y2D0L6_ARAVE|nr:hypothetical protein AVEN_50016-1 [Araneus ventricosus]
MHVVVTEEMLPRQEPYQVLEQMVVSRTVVLNPWAAAHLWVVDRVLLGRRTLVKSRSQEASRVVTHFLLYKEQIFDPSTEEDDEKKGKDDGEDDTQKKLRKKVFFVFKKVAWKEADEGLQTFIRFAG